MYVKGHGYTEPFSLNYYQTGSGWVTGEVYENNPDIGYVQVPFVTADELEIQRLRYLDSVDVIYIPADMGLTRDNFSDFMSSTSNRTSERPGVPSAAFATRQCKHKRFGDAAYVYRLRRNDSSWNPTEKANCLSYIKAEFEWMLTQSEWNYATSVWETDPAQTFIDFAHKAKCALAYNAIYPDCDADFRERVETWGWNIMYRACFGIIGYALNKLFGEQTYESLHSGNFTILSSSMYETNAAEPLFRYHKDYTSAGVGSTYPNFRLARQVSNRAMMHVKAMLHWALHFKYNGFKGDRTKIHKFITQTPNGAGGDMYFDFNTATNASNTSRTGYTTLSPADVTDSIISGEIEKVIKTVKAYLKVAKTFATYGNGMMIEFYRGGVEQGYQYHMSMMESVMWMELELGRRGDTEIINLSSRAGVAGRSELQPSDPNKSTRRCLEFMARCDENHVDYRYYNASANPPSVPVQENYRLNGYDPINDRNYRPSEWGWMWNFWNRMTGINDMYIDSWCKQTSTFTAGKPSYRTPMGCDEYPYGTFGSSDHATNRFMYMYEELQAL